MLKVNIVRRHQRIEDGYVYPYDTLILNAAPVLFLELIDNEFADWHVSTVSFTPYFERSDFNEIFGLDMPIPTIGSFKFEWSHKLFDNFLQFNLENAFGPKIGIKTYVWWSSGSGPAPDEGLKLLNNILDKAYDKENVIRRSIEKCIERRADLLYFGDK